MNIRIFSELISMVGRDRHTGFGNRRRPLWTASCWLCLLLGLGSLPALAQSSRLRPLRVACLGNSVTCGYLLKDPATEAYPAVLQGLLGPGYQVRNFGHSGATLLYQGHNPYVKTPEFREALAYRPDMAIMELGLNDTDPRDWPLHRDRFVPDGLSFIDSLRSVDPHMRIFLCSMTPIFTGHPRFESSTRVWYAQVQAALKQLASLEHIPFIDLYRPFRDRPDLFTDPSTLHPDSAGAARLARVIYRFMTGRYGGLQLAQPFQDSMVLQEGRPVKVWGLANAGVRVTLSLDGIRRSTRAAVDGRWSVVFPPMKGSFQPYTLKASSQGRTLVLKDLLVGELWLCAGQSNMEFPLRSARGGPAAARKADPYLRLFQDKAFAETDARPWDTAALRHANQLDFFSGHWQSARASSALPFSAIGYWFGRELRDSLKVPVGLLELAVGGSPQLSWLDRKTLEDDPLFEPALYNWRHSDYLMDWCRKRADLNLKYAGSPLQRHSYDPCFNVEAGLSKIWPLAIKGAIWYQGESDADNPELYARLFPLMVRDWRQHWGYDFPFYYVQLSSLDRSSWPCFRNLQRELQDSVPFSGMAVSSDLGDSLNVHYSDKRPVGRRLARLALHRSYGRRWLPDEGPAPLGLQRRENTLVLSYPAHSDLHGARGAAIRGFSLWDARGRRYPLAAVVKADRLILDIPADEEPMRLRYSWSPFSRANLQGAGNLPASTASWNLPASDTYSITLSSPKSR